MTTVDIFPTLLAAAGVATAGADGVEVGGGEEAADAAEVEGQAGAAEDGGQDLRTAGQASGLGGGDGFQCGEALGSGHAFGL